VVAVDHERSGVHAAGVVISPQPLTDLVPLHRTKTDEIVTQIIPIRYVQARQLVTDLSPLRSERATIIANDAGNSIIVTDTQANIRHLAEIIKAVDDSAEAETEIRVFRLKFASPADVASRPSR
jgi:type II secretory pathway component GspD/PulD (secretin)